MRVGALASPDRAFPLTPTKYHETLPTVHLTFLLCEPRIRTSADKLRDPACFASRNRKAPRKLQRDFEKRRGTIGLPRRLDHARLGTPRNREGDLGEILGTAQGRKFWNWRGPNGACAMAFGKRQL